MPENLNRIREQQIRDIPQTPLALEIGSTSLPLFREPSERRILIGLSASTWDLLLLYIKIEPKKSPSPVKPLNKSFFFPSFASLN